MKNASAIERWCASISHAFVTNLAPTQAKSAVTIDEGAKDKVLGENATLEREEQ